MNIFLASDLDRTILPNGAEPASPDAIPILHKVAERSETTLAYVTGRDLELIQNAVTEHGLPVPDYAIGDVGTSVYKVVDENTWEPMLEWEEEIAKDWRGKTRDDIVDMFKDIPNLRLQDDRPAQQGKFKVSYYTPEDIDKNVLSDSMQKIADEAELNLSLIFSIDEAKHTGLLDVLPKSATKIHATQFLREHLGRTEDETVFFGDSGNDIPALISGLQAVMVRNTRQDVQDEVMAIAKEKGIENKIYTAQGDFLGGKLNGNYTAGVLEGLAHFFPETISWMQL